MFPAKLCQLIDYITHAGAAGEQALPLSHPCGWLQAGLRLASSDDKDKVRKMQMEPKEVLNVRGLNGSFISFFPEQQTRLTYGIDHHTEAPIIGKQWMTWSPDEDEHYRWSIAPARNFAPSLEVWALSSP